MNYIPAGPKGVDKDRRDLARQKAESQIPKSERRREGFILSLEMSMQTIPGLCHLGRKCLKKEGHTELCWPVD